MFRGVVNLAWSTHMQSPPSTQGHPPPTYRSWLYHDLCRNCKAWRLAFLHTRFAVEAAPLYFPKVWSAETRWLWVVIFENWEVKARIGIIKTSGFVSRLSSKVSNIWRSSFFASSFLALCWVEWRCSYWFMREDCALILSTHKICRSRGGLLGVEGVPSGWMGSGLSTSLKETWFSSTEVETIPACRGWNQAESKFSFPTKIESVHSFSQ